MKPVWILVALLLLPACTTLEDETDAQFNNYIGKPLSEAVLHFGPPSTTMELDGRKYYGWTVNWQETPCQWTFEVQNKTITAAKWNGSPVACWSINYYQHR